MSLLLVLLSCSTKRGAVDSDIHNELNLKDLPKFSEREIWKKGGNPLRDRLMIKWLFSDPQAQLVFTAMTDRIKQALPDLTESDPLNISSQSQIETESVSESKIESRSQSAKPPEQTKLVVSFACRDGQQYSPCFVEQLREYYQTNTSLKVQTQHLDVFNDTRSRYYWCKSKLPVMYIQNIEMLTNERLWVPFEKELSKELERSFVADPYTSLTPSPTESVDFTQGTLYVRRNRKVHYVRSSVIPPKMKKSVTNCRFVLDQEYKRIVGRYDGAGILFYSVHPVSGEAIFLLGHMTYSTLCWCDFGGLRSWKKFRERARETAARECFEETLGLLGNGWDLVHMLEDYKTNNVFKVVNQVYYYVSHFMRVPYQDYPSLFAAKAQDIDQGLEIDQMRWFSLREMRVAVKLAIDNQRPYLVSCLHDGSPSPREYELRNEFVHTICIAEKLGILDSIEFIAKQIHSPNPLDPVTQSMASLSIASGATSSPSCTHGTGPVQDRADFVREETTSRCVVCDLEAKSKAWSFERFVSSLPSGGVGGGAKDRPRLVLKRKDERNYNPKHNGKAVLYYGMGAGSFGV